MTHEDISVISRLNPEDFDHNEWVALAYARDFATLGGRDPDGDYMADYLRLYSEKERQCISKVAAKMDFTNRLVAFFVRKKSQPTVD